MSVNEFKAASNDDDKENSQTSLIVLHKKNMKFPTSIKLQAHFTNKSFEIYRAKQATQSMISLQFGDSLSTEIIRHSNTQVRILDTKSESSLLMTLESSFQRDHFISVVRNLIKQYLEYISKPDLQEVDFYKRRETYLEK